MLHSYTQVHILTIRMQFCVIPCASIVCVRLIFSQILKCKHIHQVLILLFLCIPNIFQPLGSYEKLHMWSIYNLIIVLISLLLKIPSLCLWNLCHCTRVLPLGEQNLISKLLYLLEVSLSLSRLIFIDLWEIIYQVLKQNCIDHTSVMFIESYW